MRLGLLASVLALGGLGAFAIACSANEVEDDSSDDAIVGGQASGAEDDNVVLLVKDGKALCTATLVAQNVLVTAQHCVGKEQNGKIVDTFDPHTITVRIGGKPGAAAAAVATKIWTPRAATNTTPAAGQTTPGQTGQGGTPSPTPTATDTVRSLASMDIAAILVQSLDPAFDKLKPRRVRDRAVVETETVNVVGWNANGASMPLAQLQRMKRANVDVLADPTQQRAVSAPSTDGIAVTNKAREFVTEAVACQGDDGAPAFDAQGALTGVVAAVVGPCAAGSLSVFTDIGSQKTFLQGVMAEIAKLECSSDAKCGGTGKICDTTTFTCQEGCRNRSVICSGGLTCLTPNAAAGVPGSCGSSAGSATVTDDGGAPIDLPTDAGAPVSRSDAGAGTAGCTDQGCGGTTASPKVCDAKTQACIAGCRVGASPSMCGTGYSCKAGSDSATVGTCVANVVTAPAPPDLTPPARPNEAAQGLAGSGLSPADDNGDGGAKGKAKAKDTKSGGCSVTPGTTRAAGGGALAWLGLGLAISALRRRRS